MSQPSEDAKKIIIDEDWKQRVAAEREAARPTAAPSQAAVQPAAETSTGESPAAGKARAEADLPLPAPDLLFIVTTFYMQAVVAMGVLPDPTAGKPQARLNQARHAIDCLQVLRDKTEGNRTAEETEAIDNMLHELRLAYVAVGSKQ